MRGGPCRRLTSVQRPQARAYNQAAELRVTEAAAVAPTIDRFDDDKAEMAKAVGTVGIAVNLGDGATRSGLTVV